jgi:membrane-associated phospholipid phosphatase
MRKLLLIALLAAAYLLCSLMAICQVNPAAGKWKTWFISSGKDYRAKAPASYKTEVDAVLAAQKNMDAAMMQQIRYWSAGPPSYHWQDLMFKNWMNDTSYAGSVANMLLSVTTYDATIAAWESKYAYNRPRPFTADKRIKVVGIKADSPSYPSEDAVSAGVAVTIISHFFPALADTANKMAQQQMRSRVAAGLAFPSDVEAGYALGKAIAEKEIEATKSFANKTGWDGKMPTGPAYYNGKFALFPMAGKNKTVVLESASQFRPGPPPDYAKEMAELKNYKQTFRSKSNAFYWASQFFWEGELNRRIMENHFDQDPPTATRLYAITAIGMYDGFAACWDAKYTYWGIRPDQYDTTYHALVPTPPFPGYPSGHAMLSGVMAELYSYYFPEDSAFFRRKAREAAESRFQAGIHFRSDNEVGLETGRKVANAIIQKVKKDEASIH